MGEDAALTAGACLGSRAHLVCVERAEARGNWRRTSQSLGMRRVLLIIALPEKKNSNTRG